MGDGIPDLPTSAAGPVPQVRARSILPPHQLPQAASPAF